MRSAGWLPWVAVVAVLAGASTAAAQRAATPAVQPVRVAGELGAGAVGLTLGAEGGLVVAAGVAYLVTGRGGDINDPKLIRALTPILWVGGGVGAGTASWLVSRVDGQTSDWGANVAVSSVVTALAFKYAGWPLTQASRARQLGRWRRLAPVWMASIAAAAVATSTRDWR